MTANSTTSSGKSKKFKDVALRVKDEISNDHVGIVAAGIAFYVFFALFPAISALISIYGLVVDPATVERQMSQLTGIIPGEAQAMIKSQLNKLVSKPTEALGWGLLFSILLSIWSANKGMKSLFQGVTIAFNETKKRGFIKENALTLAFTFGFILIAIISMALIIGLPALAGSIGITGYTITLISLLRWPLLAAIMLLALAFVFKVAPYETKVKWRWATWGSAIATILWLIASWGLNFYVKNFGSYDETYGSLAAVIILLLWFMVSAFIVLLGAEIDSEYYYNQNITIKK